MSRHAFFAASWWSRTVVRLSVFVSAGAVALAGCGYFDGGQSAGVDAAPSVPAEKVMSGGYEVGPDGKLVNPNDVDVDDRPQIPAEMTKEDAAGAEAFAKYYLASLAYSRATGDVERLKEYALPDCGWCQDNIQRVESAYSQGGWIVAEDYIIEETAEVLDLKPIGHDLWHVSLEVTSPAFTVYNGKALEHLPQRSFTVILQSKYTQDGWRMWEIEGKERE